MHWQKLNQQGEDTWGPVLRAAFIKEGLPGEWGMAIARHESNFDPHQVNMTAGDGLRGGSYGLCQMSLKTAKSLGFEGLPTVLLDPWINAHYAAVLCACNVKVVGMDFARVAAAYNCGPTHVLQDTVPGSHGLPGETASDYVPHVVAYAQEYATKFGDEDVCEDNSQEQV